MVRLPITLPMLHNLVSSLSSTIGAASQRLMFQSMFLLAFYSCLRVGEITSSQGILSNILEFQHIKFSHDQQSFTVHFAKYKHSPSTGAAVTVRAQSSPFCPVQALLKYLFLRGKSPGYLYCRPSGQPVSRTEFSTVLSHALQYIGIDPKRYTSHSFRIGSATFAANLGWSDAKIRAFGRWRSDAFKQYIRLG